MSSAALLRHAESARGLTGVTVYGRITRVVGLSLEATGPSAQIGDLCWIDTESGGAVRAVVSGFNESRLLLMPLGDTTGIAPEARVTLMRERLRVRVGEELVGRVLNGLGEVIDSLPAPETTDTVPVDNSPPKPLDRVRITEPIETGIRSIDAFTTCGKGQRMGILAGSGIGKSKLLGMIARNTNADVNVIALIGERGKEVRDFLEADLGEEGLRRSILVVATSNEPALMRVKGAHLATAIAEWFRDRGNDVMLMMDSVTRFAMAQREVGLAIGEPPTTKGYPPSVFAELPRLLERTGSTQSGSITGFYSVLVEADDIQDPVGDAVRSIVDGHVVLSRDLATRGHYPAVDVLESVSRVMIDVAAERHQELSAKLRGHLATYRDAQDLIDIGAYTRGSNPQIDTAIDRKPAIDALLRQGLNEAASLDGLEAAMESIL